MRGGAEAARRAHNPKVRGSNPLPATLKKAPRKVLFCLIVGETMEGIGRFHWLTSQLNEPRRKIEKIEFIISPRS